MTLHDGSASEPDDADADPDDGERRRPRSRWLPVAALAVPVVAAGVVLGARAASGGAFDATAAGLRVSAAAAAVGGEDSMQFGGGTGGPGYPSGGGSSVAMPEPGPYDVAVVCASHRGQGAHLTVTVDGATVGEADVACSDAADPDADPLVTQLRVEELDAAWSFEVTSGSPAAVTVVVS